MKSNSPLSRASPPVTDSRSFPYPAATPLFFLSVSASLRLKPCQAFRPCSSLLDLDLLPLS